VPFLHSIRDAVIKREWKNWTRDDFVRGTPKGPKFKKRHRAQQKYNSGIRNQGLKERLRLGSRRTLNKTFRQTIELEVTKQIVGTSIKLRKMRVSGHCGGVGSF
jgi:hypothetical protein